MIMGSRGTDNFLVPDSESRYAGERASYGSKLEEIRQ